MDAGNLAEFSQGAFRSLHTNIPSKFNYYSDSLEISKTMDFSDTVDRSKLLENNFNGILRGMLQDPMATGGLGCSPEVRNKFQKNKCGFGMDLFSTDVMRGRDFGVAPYIEYFSFCDPTASIKKWQDLKPYFSDEHFTLLQRIYANMNDIDLLVGVLLERKQFGAYGKIGACIVAEQFRRFKFGDRFFYTSRAVRNPFTAGYNQ